MTRHPISMAGLILLASFPVCGQPSFEAASVKPCSDGDTRGATYGFTPGGLKVTNGTLKGLIEMAYEIRDFQISGGPGWMNSQGYDIFAKSSPDDPGTMKETRQKLQALLAERFQLKVHRETKELPVYALTVGKNGSKLKEPTASTEGPPSGIRRECGQTFGTKTSMANLATTLSRLLGLPVLDRTGLTAQYDFQIEWTPDTGPCPNSPSDGPSLSTALQERLGLKLESTKGPVEVIVVDHAEKADAN